MKPITRLFVTSEIRIDRSIIDPNYRTRLIKSSEARSYDNIPVLENCSIERDGEIRYIKSDSEVRKESMKIYGIEVCIVGSIAYLDYVLFNSEKRTDRLSTILGFNSGFLASGNLETETFRSIQYKLEAVLAAFTLNYSKVGDEIFSDETLEELRFFSIAEHDDFY